MTETWIPLNTDPTTARTSGVTVHGRLSFDVPFLSPIADNLWMGGCADHLWLPDAVEHLVSLYSSLSYTIRHELKTHLSVALLDSSEQGFDLIDDVASWVNTCRGDGPTVVHCEAGLNRSALVVARALMLDGMTAEEAITFLRERRSTAVLCNKSFESWLMAA